MWWRWRLKFHEVGEKERTCTWSLCFSVLQDLVFVTDFFFFIMKIYIFKDYLLPGSIWELTALYVFCKHLKTLDYLWCKGWCWFLLFVHLVACWSQSFFLSFFVFFNRKLSLSPVFTGTHDAMWLYNDQWVMWLTSWPWQ